MPKSINFIRSLRNKKTAQRLSDLKLLRRVAIGFGVIVVVCLGLFAVKLYFQRQLTQVKTNRNKLVAQWEQLKADELGYIKYVSKLKILSELFGMRQQKQQALAQFRSMFPDGVSVVGLKYSAIDQEIVFQIKSSSIFTLEKAWTILAQTESSSQYGQIIKDRLSRNQLGEYTLSLRVKLNTQGAKS